MNENQPLWYALFIAVGGGLMKLLSMLDIGGIFKSKIKLDKDCAKEVSRLKFLIVKQHSTLKLLATFLNNPENVETTKQSIEEHLKDIAPVIEQIEKENLLVKNE